MPPETKPEKVFVEGMNVKLPSDKAPEFILLQMGFNATKFFRWCQEHQDDKGWVNVTIKKSTKGNIYAELDTWKPHIESRGLPPIADVPEPKLEDFDISQPVDDIPF